MNKDAEFQTKDKEVISDLWDTIMGTTDLLLPDVSKITRIKIQIEGDFDV